MKLRKLFRNSVIKLNEIEHFALSDESINWEDFSSHVRALDYFLINNCDITLEEKDQMFLLKKDVDADLRSRFNEKWYSFMPLQTHHLKNENDTLELKGKTEDEIRAWLHSLEISYDTFVFVSGMITTWKMVIRYYKEILCTAGGIDALDGSWRLPFINEDGGYALFYRYKDMS